ncbi:putative sugar O-methyltransferase [Streptomyces sp. NBC_00708]
MDTPVQALEGPPIDTLAPIMSAEELIPLPAPDDRVHSWWTEHRQRLARKALEGEVFDNYVVKEEMLEVFPKKAERGDRLPPDFLRECGNLMGQKWVQDKLDGYVDPVAEPTEAISEKTASQLYYLARLEQLSSGQQLGHVVEIGAGFGNLALLTLALGGCSRYTIIDLPDVLPISRSYLSAHLSPEQLAKVEFIDAMDTDALTAFAGTEADIVVSTFALTEMPAAMRRWYAAFVLSKAGAFYVVGQRTFKGEDAGGFAEYVQRPFTLTVQPYLYDPIGWPTFEMFGRAA